MKNLVHLFARWYAGFLKPLPASMADDAVFTKNEQALTYFLSSRPHFSDFRMAFFKAIEKGWVEGVRIFLASPMLPEHLESFILDMAVDSRHTEIVRLLIDRCDPRYSDSHPLLCAVQGGDEATVRVLLPVSDLEGGSHRIIRSSCFRHQTTIFDLIYTKMNGTERMDATLFSLWRKEWVAADRLLSCFPWETISSSERLWPLVLAAFEHLPKTYARYQDTLLSNTIALEHRPSTPARPRL